MPPNPHQGLSLFFRAILNTQKAFPVNSSPDLVWGCDLMALPAKLPPREKEGSRDVNPDKWLSSNCAMGMLCSVYARWLQPPAPLAENDQTLSSPEGQTSRV